MSSHDPEESWNMNTSMSMNGVTAEEITEACNWIADAYPQSPYDMSDEHPVYSETAERVQRFVDRRYPGGWYGFVSDCCTYA
jgi:hypothetical protein